MGDHGDSGGKWMLSAACGILTSAVFAVSVLAWPLPAQQSKARRASPHEESAALVRPKSTPVIQPRVWSAAEAQTSDESVVVWVFFTDKGIFSLDDYDQACRRTGEDLTECSRQRRQKVNKKVDFADLPVARDYIRAVLALGMPHRATSKWLNGISVEARPSQLNEIAVLPFVREIQCVGRARREPLNPGTRKSTIPVSGRMFRLDYGPSQGQLEQIHVPAAHELGYSGEGVMILMLDTGFRLEHDAFKDVQVIAQYDFINKDSLTSNEAEDPPYQHDHGTGTLSAAGGASPGQLYGPAYGASFLLAKTEDVSSETPVEEDYWVAAVEWGDSLGADIASSSLIYLDWYEYEDMDGNTATITRAADMAAARGILVCNAAGNEGNNDWHYIAAPADADSILSCGAVDEFGEIAFFSSHGPSCDGRIKPEVAARGYSTYIADPYDIHGYYEGTGTSFATPLVAGAAALVLEAHPDWPPMQVREALMMTANHSGSPDNRYGWGIINVLAAIQYQATAMKGDANNDGVIDILDALTVVNFLLGLSEPGPGQVWASDCNGDGTLNVLDVVCIARIILSPPMSTE